MAFWNAPPFKYGLFWVSMLVLRGVHLQMGWLFYCPLSVRGCIPTLEESFWSSTWHFCLAMHKNMMQPKRMLHSEVRIPTQTKHYWPPTQTPSKIPKPYGSNMGGRTNKHPWNHNGFTWKTPSRITIRSHPKWVPRNDPWPFYTLTWHFQSAVLRWRYSMIFNVCTDQELSNHSRKSWSRI